MGSRNDFETFNIPVAEETPKVSRRTVLRLGVGAAAALAGAFKWQGPGENRTALANQAEPTPEAAESDQVALAPQGESAESFNPYAGMEHVDPHNLIGLSEEELVKLGEITMDDSKTPEELGQEVLDRMLLLLNAGNTEEDKRMAEGMGLDLSAYSTQTYRTHLRKGMSKNHADETWGGAEGMPTLMEFEDFSSRRFASDPRYITSIESEGVDIQEVTRMGAVVETLGFKMTNRIPEELGEDPYPYTYDVSSRVVLSPLAGAGNYTVNVETFEYTEA